MKRILVLFALFAVAAGYAQTVEKQTFVYAVKQTDTLRLDRYVALTPDSRTKPCLMFVFGGGFVGGRRDNASFLSYFEYYARKGYVVVSIDYRLGMKKAMQAGTLSEERLNRSLPYDATSWQRRLYRRSFASKSPGLCWR